VFLFRPQVIKNEPLDKALGKAPDRKTRRQEKPSLVRIFNRKIPEKGEANSLSRARLLIKAPYSL